MSCLEESRKERVNGESGLAPAQKGLRTPREGTPRLTVPGDGGTEMEGSKVSSQALRGVLGSER